MEVVEEGRGPKVLKSKSPKVFGPNELDLEADNLV